MRRVYEGETVKSIETENKFGISRIKLLKKKGEKGVPVLDLLRKHHIHCIHQTYCNLHTHQINHNYSNQYIHYIVYTGAHSTHETSKIHG